MYHSPYLQSIGQRLEFKSAAEEAVNALTWVLSLAGCLVWLGA